MVKESGGEKRRKRKMQNFDFYHPGPPGAGYYPYYAPQFIPRPLDQQQQQQAQQPLASSGVEKSTKQKKREHRSAEQTDALMSVSGSRTLTS